MKTIKLYGELAKRFGQEHQFDVRSASEAIHAMCVNFTGFKEFMATSHKYGVGFKVFVGTNSIKKESDTAFPSSDREVIRISPCIFGSGGVAKFLVGLTLITVGFLTSWTGVGGFLGKMGAALVLGGLSQLLSEPPRLGGNGMDETKESYLFAGPENVTRQGGAIPIGYGRVMVGSTVISAGIIDK